MASCRTVGRIERAAADWICTSQFFDESVQLLSPPLERRAVPDTQPALASNHFSDALAQDGPLRGLDGARKLYPHVHLKKEGGLAACASLIICSAEACISRSKRLREMT